MLISDNILKTKLRIKEILTDLEKVIDESRIKK